MIYTICSEEYGKIEIDSEKRTAYFYDGDFIYDIDKNGTFEDIYARVFMVSWPIPGTKFNYIELAIRNWKSIGKNK